MITTLRWCTARASHRVFVHFSRGFACPLRSNRLLSLTLVGTLTRLVPSSSAFHNSSVLTDTKSVTMATDGGVRRTINFKDFDVFGFDLDHTIAKYKLVKLFQVAYQCVTTFLVDERGYDPVIKTGLHTYKNFICKGLFLDVKRGNILKLAPDGTILKATHGTRLLSEQELVAVYGKDMKWDLTDTVKKNMCNGANNYTYRFFENYFDCPALVAVARIIDLIDDDKKNKSLSVEEKQELYTKVWRDALDSLHNMYDPHNFSAEKGGYFTIVKEDPSQFVEECSTAIRSWLKALRQGGKLVFLLTSSQIDYASCLLEACLGEDWASYFDISLFHGRKPGFFNFNNPFYELENAEETEKATELKKNGCYSQGNLDDLNKFFAAQLGREQFKVLYFGDNICSDCYPSKHFADWGAVLLLEEMDAEGYLCSDGTVPGHEHDGDAVNKPAAKKKKLMEHSTLVTKEEIDYLITDFWGPFLIHPTDDMKPPLVMNTFWGDVISRYSDIAVPSLEYLSGVPVDHEFDTFTGESGDATGFHPGRPSSLLP